MTGIDCVGGDDAVLGLYVDDVAVPGSRRVAPKVADRDAVNPTGITSGAIPAGSHTLRLTATCPAGFVSVDSPAQRQFGWVLLGP